MKIGFIGSGNMASAIIGGVLKKGLMKVDEIICSDLSKDSREKIETLYKITVTKDNLEVVKKSEIIVLAVKPQFYELVIREIKGEIRPEQRIITIAPGKTIAWLEEQFEKTVKLVRTMPNTPAMVLEGMTGVCKNDNVTEEELEEILEILSAFGKAEVVSENLLDVVVSVSGSSPAYVYILIEAMADAAVADGMPRDKAYQFAAQAVYGSAKMVLETGKHPGELKDMVCSPAGTTIEAVRVLEERGFRSAVIEAMKACVEKTKRM